VFCLHRSRGIDFQHSHMRSPEDAAFSKDIDSREIVQNSSISHRASPVRAAEAMRGLQPQVPRYLHEHALHGPLASPDTLIGPCSLAICLTRLALVKVSFRVSLCHHPSRPRADLHHHSSLSSRAVAEIHACSLRHRRLRVQIWQIGRRTTSLGARDCLQ
jgi:hypothetical protein